MKAQITATIHLDVEFDDDGTTSHLDQAFEQAASDLPPNCELVSVALNGVEP